MELSHPVVIDLSAQVQHQTNKTARERERERRLITIPYKKETTYLVQ